MEDWDQETLERVVKEKHGNEKPTNTTNIICKFFLEAVEKKQYGWCVCTTHLFSVTRGHRMAHRVQLCT